MKTFKICLILLVISTLSYSQSNELKNITLSGIVKDSVTKKAIEYPTIAVFTDSLKLIKAVAGGADGKFFIEVPLKGKYFLSVSMMGYSTLKKELLIDGESKRVDVGEILILEGVLMSEVTVVGVKPLIKNDPEKLTYNLESDPQSLSSPLVDILRKVPMLSVDGENTVRLNGETNFKVLVNGRSTGILVKNFKEAIKSMPASSIKSIEVITDPPAKYDAEGVAGIINIITNRKNSNGYSGNISLSANTLGGYSGGGYISFQKGKFALTTNLYRGTYFSNKSYSISETENYLSDQFKYSKSTSNYDSRNTSNQFSIEASYDIDSLNFITLSGWGYNGTSVSGGISEYLAKNSQLSTTRSYKTIYEAIYGYGTGSGSISYQKNYKKPDKNLIFSYGLDISPTNRDVTTSIDPLIDFYPYDQNSKNSAKEMENTFQVDFYNPINNSNSIETGLKYILRQNISNTDIELFDQESGIWQKDPSKINDLDYTQHIGSFYGGYLYKKKSFTAKAGIRGEFTQNDGISKSYDGNLRFDNSQFDIVPYLSFSYIIGKGRSLTLGFSQRLNRPGIWYLNPYVNDSDPMNISYGNPELNTVRRNNFNIGYRQSSQKWNLSLNLSGDFTNNDITNIRSVNEDGVNISTYENIGINKSARFNFNYSYRNGEKFSIYTNGSVKYSVISSKELDLSNKGMSYGGGFGANFALWKKATLNWNAYFYGGDITIQSRNSVNYSTSIGFTQRLLKDMVYFSAYVSEPLTKSKKYTYDSEDNTYKSHRESVNYQRSLNISLNWRFGKIGAQVKKTRKSSTDDKMKGDSGGGA